MTSDLPGQARAKAPLNIFITHFILDFITSRERWKNIPIAWETCGKGDDVLQMGTWHSDASQSACRGAWGFFQLVAFNRPCYFRDREPLGIQAHASAELEGFRVAPPSWNWQLLGGKH